MTWSMINQCSLVVLKNQIQGLPYMIFNDHQNNTKMHYYNYAQVWSTQAQPVILPRNEPN